MGLLSLHQAQSLNDEFGDPDTLPKCSEIINRREIEEAFEKEYAESTYKSFLDYIICNLVPELDEMCQSYYKGTGEKLINSFSPKLIERMDATISKVLKGLELPDCP